MALSGSFGNTTATSSKDGASSETGKQAEQRRIQGDMVIYQSDMQKLEREMNLLRLQLRDSEKKLKALTLDIKTKQDLIKKKERSVFEVDEQLRQLKRKLNLLK